MHIEPRDAGRRWDGRLACRVVRAASLRRRLGRTRRDRTSRRPGQWLRCVLRPTATEFNNRDPPKGTFPRRSMEPHLREPGLASVGHRGQVLARGA